MTFSLQSITDAIAADPGLLAAIPTGQLNKGLAASKDLNRVLIAMIEQTGVNADGIISTEDMQAISDALWLPRNAQPWREFWLAHGNDNGEVVSGFHWVQNDGGTLLFRGRNFVDTIADGIYHYGFQISEGRYANEDGNANAEIREVAGWLNYFLNGRSLVWGTEGNDDLGSGVYDELFADARNETFYGGAGRDRIWADLGDDRAFGGLGADQLAGGEGDDRLSGEYGNDSLWGEAGLDTLVGGADDDHLGGGLDADLIDGGDGADVAGGDDGNDRLIGGTGNDTLYGGEGRDRLEGGAGADDLHGGTGGDRLFGHVGDDTLNGDEAADTLNGGAGADLFHLWEMVQAVDVVVFAPGDSGRSAGAIDRVEGFSVGTDKIDLTAFGAITLEELDFAGAGKASFYYDGSYLRIDADGDRAVDMMVNFAWVAELSRDDFILA